MKDQLPAPDFDANRYERPTHPWTCGKASDGEACHLGPDFKGRCRATFECTPGLELKAGESKGRYRCTRPKERGGPCENGPLPNGTCGRPIPKCRPLRSLRSKRVLLTWCVLALTVASFLVLLGGKYRFQFINPGEISVQHSSARFTEASAKLGLAKSGSQDNCIACHKPAEGGPLRWSAAAFAADPGPFNIRKLVSASATAMSSIDMSCLRCHKHNMFHQPNLADSTSCSSCHQEHLGGGPMKPPSSANCNLCHANAEVMETAFQRGKALPAGAFDYRPSLGWVQFKTPRPARGYTKVFQSFAADHPEFQIRADGLKEPNTLKFNHQRHLAEDIPLLNGKKIDCATCHQPNAAGDYHGKISYTQHCQACHSLQFDVENPKLLIPHGSSEAARSFLQSLPAQYAEHGARVKGITGKAELEEYVRQSLRQIRDQILSGDNPEEKVFFSTKRSAPGTRIGQLPGSDKPLYYGCAYCHEVKPVPSAAPAITAPVIPDRWFVRASFDHAKHLKVECAQCHDAAHSRDTAEILLPAKATCVECHSPKGGVANNCSVCHSYHAPRKR
jgi:hypothetical protein